MGLVSHIINLNQKGQIIPLRAAGLFIVIIGAFLFANEFTRVIEGNPINEIWIVIGILFIIFGGLVR